MGKKQLRTILGCLTGISLSLLFIFNIQNIPSMAVNAYTFLQTRPSVVGETAQDFFTVMLGIIVEAMPFVILGVIISTLLRTFVPAEKFIHRLPKNRIARRVLLSFGGVLMPVCECGNIPVARSFMLRGLSPQEATIFLLAAPSINLVTFIVTWEAFNTNREVAIWRVVLTFMIANLIAILIAKLPAKSILTEGFAAMCNAEQKIHKNSITRLTGLFRTEMWLITRMLCLGAAIASATQTFVPRDTITAIASNPALAILVMLALAFVISICSSVDSFFALAYTGTFSLGAITAFLVAGPMVDIKMILMMKTTYTTRALVVITAGVAFATFISTLGLHYVLR